MSLVYEFSELVLQSFIEMSGIGGKVQFLRTVRSEHAVHTALEPLVVVLQREIQHRSLVHLITPKRQAGAHMKRELRHEKRLSDFRRAGKKVGACKEQAVDDGRPALEDCFVEIVHGDGVEIMWIVHSIEPLKITKPLPHDIIRLVFVWLVCYTCCRIFS